MLSVIQMLLYLYIRFAPRSRTRFMQEAAALARGRLGAFPRPSGARPALSAKAARYSLYGVQFCSIGARRASEGWLTPPFPSLARRAPMLQNHVRS